MKRNLAIEIADGFNALAEPNTGIVVVRGQHVILDSALAKLYGVSTKQLNRKVRRNPARFPPDFAFLLSSAEWEGVRSQIAVSTGKRAPYRRFLPYVFTECGALMAAGLVNSPRAVEVSRYIAQASAIWPEV